MRKLISVFFIYPTFDRLHDFWVFKAVDMVVSPAVIAVRSEVSAVVRAFERHAEIITVTVQGIAGVGEGYMTLPIKMGDKDI